MKIVKIIAVAAAALGFVSCGSGSGSDVSAPHVPTTSYVAPDK